MRHKLTGGAFTNYPTGKKLARDTIIYVACDIWIPSARSDVLRTDNVARLNTKIVAQGANIPATAEAEAMLHARGILVLPDFIANAGGVICAAIEYHGGTESTAFAAIAEKITRNTRQMLDQATSDRSTPRAAAIALAEKRITQATGYRRWS